MSKLPREFVRYLTVAGAVFATPLASAQQATPPLAASIFQDHGVLQRDRPIHIWGKVRPDETVRVTIGGNSASGYQDKTGTWSADLPALPAGGPYTLTISTSSGRSQTINDVLVGDVWLCSGQSNMEFDVAHSLNSQAEIDSANNAQMRILTVIRDAAAKPLDEFKSPVRWQAVTSQSIPDFSAACYFMARDLYKAETVPFGLIDASWGGTAIDAWRPDKAAHSNPETRDRLALSETYNADPAKGSRMWGETWGAWWRSWSHDAPGREPWQANAPGEWKPVPYFSMWENWGVPALSAYNGILWYRTDVTLTAAQAAKSATLTLGPIDDLDVSFVNGVSVGTTNSWDRPRAYLLAPGTLHAGTNHIVVAAYDTGGAGGMLGTPDQRAIQFGDGTSVPLPEPEGWSYRVTSGASDPPYAPWVGNVASASIYNGMISPLGGYGLRGVAWYQGEADATSPTGYAGKLANMMGDWRAQFGNPKLPFLIVQLAGYGPRNADPRDSGFASIRDEQRKAVAADGNAALVLAIDLGEINDIHPANKQDVGHRLAQAAHVLTYGGSGPATGPQAIGVTRTGSMIAVDFGEPLVTYSANQAMGFELCDASRRSCRFVSARVSGNSVLIDRGADAADHIRFCWGDSPICNLFGRSGLPAGPFELALP